MQIELPSFCDLSWDVDSPVSFSRVARVMMDSDHLRVQQSNAQTNH
jgi:hypothetical protein